MTANAAYKLASAWAGKGIPAFPVRISQKPDGSLNKRPLTENGFDDATCDPATLQELFIRARPRDGEVVGVGLHPGGAGLVVLDLDVKGNLDGLEELEELAEKYGEIPLTFGARTPSGGMHLWFKKPSGADVIGNRKLSAGIDVRADKGYVVAPGVETPWGKWERISRDVAELPRWVLDVLSRSESHSAGRSTDAPTTEAPEYVQAALEDELRRVEAAPEGERNETLNKAAFRMGQLLHLGLSEDDVRHKLTTVAGGIGLEPEEISKTIASGLNAGKLEPRGPDDEGDGIDLSGVQGKPSETAQDATGGPNGDGGKAKFKLVSLEGKRPRRVLWLWRERIPIGGVTLLPGRQGLGKGHVLYSVAANVTLGTATGDLNGEPADVIVIGHEDALDQVVVPRLMAAGADMSRVWTVVASDPSKVEAFSVPDDVPALRQALEHVGNPKLVTIDPLDGHMSGDTHKKAEVQQAIGYLTRVAEEFSLAVLGTAHHNKGIGHDPLDRVSASNAFTTAPRSVLTVAPHPENEDERVLALNKSNLVKREDVPVLRFRIDSVAVRGDGEMVETSKAVWLGEAEGVSADDVLRTTDDGGPKGKEAEAWLKAMLKDGEMKKEDIISAGKGVFSERTIQRAMEELDVQYEQRPEPGKRGPGPSWWWLP